MSSPTRASVRVRIPGTPLRPRFRTGQLVIIGDVRGFVVPDATAADSWVVVSPPHTTPVQIDDATRVRVATLRYSHYERAWKALDDAQREHVTAQCRAAGSRSPQREIDAWRVRRRRLRRARRATVLPVSRRLEYTDFGAA